MAQLANITVKKHDGTTDVVYTGIEPASSGNPATWKNQTVGDAQAHQPELRVSAKRRGTMVEVKGTFRYPQVVTDSTTGVKKIQRWYTESRVAAFDSQMAQADVNEASSQCSNLWASALVKEMLRTGTSAN